MSDCLIERIDLNKHTKVVTRNKVKTESRFMKENFINSYSDIYYKKIILVDGSLDKTEIDELRTFIAISSRLKVIKIYNYSNELLNIIVSELEAYKKKNVQIQIEEKNNDINVIYNTVTYLKKSYKKYFDEYNITFKLNYSKEYKKNNFMKAFNLKLFSVIILLVAVVFGFTIGINYYNQYIDQGHIEDQMLEIEEILNDAEISIDLDEPIFVESDTPIIDENEQVTTTTKKKNTGDAYASAYYTNYKQVFSELLKKNKDTVAWIACCVPI